ncbi:MAG: hypothetical protein ABJE95_10925 [Byssovorax sp.]
MLSWKLAAALWFPLLAGCGKPMVCTTEVTEGAGTFKAVAQGHSDHRPVIERESLSAACEQLCVGTRINAPRAACISRCAVDASMGKIGVRTSCTEGSL